MPESVVTFTGIRTQAAGLPLTVAAHAIDELLGYATPQLLLELAQAMPLRAATVKAIHRAMQLNHARLGHLGR